MNVAPSRGWRVKVSARLQGVGDGPEGGRGMNVALEGAWGGEESVLENGNF